MQDYKAPRPKSRRFSLRRKAHKAEPRKGGIFKGDNFKGIVKAPPLAPLPRRPRRPGRWAGGLRALGGALRAAGRVRRIPAASLFTLGVLWLAGGMAWGVLRAWEQPLSALGIAGNEKLTAMEVAAAAGLYPGVPVGGLDPLAVAQRLLEHPRIARADVRRMIPGRLELQIAERQAAALALLPGGHTAIVDREGIVIENDPAPASLPERPLPEVRGEAAGALAGAPLQDPALRRGLAFAQQAAAEAPLAGERIRLDARDPFTFHLALAERGRMLILPAREAESALKAYLAAEPTLLAAMPEYRTADLRATPREGVSWIALSR